MYPRRAEYLTAEGTSREASFTSIFQALGQTEKEVQKTTRLKDYKQLTAKGFILVKSDVSRPRLRILVTARLCGSDARKCCHILMDCIVVAYLHVGGLTEMKGCRTMTDVRPILNWSTLCFSIKQTSVVLAATWVDIQMAGWRERSLNLLWTMESFIPSNWTNKEA